MLKLWLKEPMDFSKVDPLEIEILNDHTVVSSYMELLDEVFK